MTIILEVGSAPIYVKEAEKAVLSLEEGTNNSVSDTANYVLEAGSDEPDTTIFSKADLTINGTGSLTIEGNYNNGITSKDDLKIMQGTMNISAVGDAITYLLETGVTTGGSGFGPGGDMQPGGGQRGKGDRNTTINETTNTESNTVS